MIKKVSSHQSVTWIQVLLNQKYHIWHIPTIKFDFEGSSWYELTFNSITNEEQHHTGIYLEWNNPKLKTHVDTIVKTSNTLLN